MYRLIRFFLVVAAVLAFAYSIFIAAITPSSLKNNAAFKEREFSPAINYVEQFRISSGRLPTISEFDAWKVTEGRENQALFLETSGSLSCDEYSFGAIPQGSYGLSVWRGEWFECYASWLPGYSFDYTLRNGQWAIALLLAFGTVATAGALALKRKASRLTTQSRGPP